MAGFVQRMVGAARLDPAVYEEVEADKGAVWQALGVVALSAVAAGIGGAFTAGGRGFFALLFSALFAWVAWAFVTWIVGTMFLPEPGTKSDMGELLRTIGFAQGPGILRVFGGIPLLGGFINIAVWIWMLVAMVVAVRQALDYTSTGRAVGVCVIGWIIALCVAMITAFLLGASLAFMGSRIGGGV